ncbi:aminotransferase class I and II [Solidesulfovibrio fructosivorans JJ]]|uniref:Aminotransferase n=1 Tax=Solidesulfovibrio fructosivorans JJ] TaxID=596151 RepID=E1K0W0_SOLFR|nr:pyridoxal phosphate-dependent aminotransferase [Solidesulfovibrio fructosivorans]EFL49725.1 aminotransferase class I and II [Solidesulfovibrio fructosivorans JJ]]
MPSAIQHAFTQRAKAIKISATKLMPMIAAGVGDCVSLGQGVPSFGTPAHVVEAVCRALRDSPAAGKYSLQPGMPELRWAVAEKLATEKGLQANPETEIAITVGGMEALLCAVLCLCQEGDEVIVPEPFYPSHVEQVCLAQATPVLVPLRRGDWSLDPAAVAAAVTPRTKAIIINSPHNPTGSVFAEKDLLAVAEIALRHDLYVICDDTYDALSYDAPAFSLTTVKELQPRLVAVGSFSKRYALTGWRVGFAFAPEPIMAQMLKVHDCTAICAPTPAQIAALASLTGPQGIFEGFVSTLAARRKRMQKHLDAMSPTVRYNKPGGAFYVMARYDLPAAPMNVATRLIREGNVITIPGDSFGPGGESSLRLSFGGDEADIDAGCERLAAWFEAERKKS